MTARFIVIGLAQMVPDATAIRMGRGLWFGRRSVKTEDIPPKDDCDLWELFFNNSHPTPEEIKLERIRLGCTVPGLTEVTEIGRRPSQKRDRDSNDSKENKEAPPKKKQRRGLRLFGSWPKMPKRSPFRQDPAVAEQNNVPSAVSNDWTFENPVFDRKSVTEMQRRVEVKFMTLLGEETSERPSAMPTEIKDARDVAAIAENVNFNLQTEKKLAHGSPKFLKEFKDTVKVQLDGTLKSQSYLDNLKPGVNVYGLLYVVDHAGDQLFYDIMVHVAQNVQNFVQGKPYAEEAHRSLMTRIFLTKERSWLVENGKKAIDVAGDGSCMFHAIYESLPDEVQIDGKRWKEVVGADDVQNNPPQRGHKLRTWFYGKMVEEVPEMREIDMARFLDLSQEEESTIHTMTPAQLDEHNKSKVKQYLQGMGTNHHLYAGPEDLMYLSKFLEVDFKVTSFTHEPNGTMTDQTNQYRGSLLAADAIEDCDAGEVERAIALSLGQDVVQLPVVELVLFSNKHYNYLEEL